MKWTVELHDEFYADAKDFPLEVMEEIAVKAKLLEEVGAHLGRPYVDTLKGSKFSNMKELRFSAQNGIWRLAFAFDTKRKAILLVAGDKRGRDQKKFYKALIKVADSRFEKHLNQQNK